MPEIQKGGNTRLNSEALAVYAKFHREADAIKSLKLMLPLVGEACFEIYKTVEYSKETGEPVRDDWVSYSHVWDGLLWINYGWNGLFIQKDSPNFKPILDLLPPKKIISIEYNGEMFVIEHVPPYREEGGTTPAHIRIRKSEKITIIEPEE